ncbi:GDSL-type esterase/lipase family protein [Buttiauxella sp. HR94]|nr:GDSL-type esterase/lipase family protein [Buttiauxella sp. HR94]
MTIYNTRNPLGSTDPRDLFDNAQNYDQAINSITQAIWLDRFGVTRRSWYGLELMVTEAAAKYGLITLTGVSFTTGATVNLNEALLNPADNNYYQWTGTFPVGGKVVPPNSSPQSTGGQGPGKWLNVLDGALRSQLNTNGGAAMVRADDGRTVQQWLVAVDSAEYKARNTAAFSRIDYLVHSRGAFKVLFQGDSLTAGFDRSSTDVRPADNGDWATHATTTYPERFTDFLSEQSGCNVGRVIRAISGYTAEQSLNEPAWQANPGCDVAILMLGTNDASGNSTLDVYMDCMEKLIRRFIKWGMAVVVSLPTGGPTPGGLWFLWAKRLRNLATLYGCIVFDPQDMLYHRNPGAISADGVHFNTMGYALHAHQLASLFMGGGLLNSYTKISNETYMFPGVSMDNYGYCDATGNVAVGRSQPGTFTRAKTTGVLPPKQKAIMTFSFYLDAAAANITGKVQGECFVLLQDTNWFVGTANKPEVPYYKRANTQAPFHSTLVEVGAYSAPGPIGTNGEVSGATQFLGRIIGRGWHTITIHNDLKGGAVNESYVNGLVVTPVPVGFSANNLWSEDERKIRVVHSKKFPSPSGVSGVPSAVPLTSFFMRCPQSLLPTGRGNVQGDFSLFYNGGFAKLRIVSANGIVFEGVVIRGSTLKSFRVVQTFTTATTNLPTITAKLSTALGVVTQPGSFGTNMPNEAITDYNGGLTDSATYPGFVGGIYLQFTVAWSGTPPGDYWTVELDGGDYFGNSEAAFGTI